MKNIDLCFLESFSSLCEALKSINQISKTQQLKLGLSKTQINSPVQAKSEYSLPIAVINYGLINPIYVGEKVILLTETEEIVAIAKPSKIHGHPLHYDESDNILSALREMGRADLLSVNADSYDRGLLYRLDYETSGLLLYAKTEKLFKEVRENFHSQVKLKKYIAKLSEPIDRPMTLKNNLKAFGAKGYKMVESPDGKQATIEVRPLKGNLVEVLLNEGVRHQIRAQLSLNGMPIVGDGLYGGEPAERLYLHCLEYELNGDKFSCDCPW